MCTFLYRDLKSKFFYLQYYTCFKTKPKYFIHDDKTKHRVFYYDAVTGYYAFEFRSWTDISFRSKVVFYDSQTLETATTNIFVSDLTKWETR